MAPLGRHTGENRPANVRDMIAATLFQRTRVQKNEDIIIVRD